MMKLFIHWDEDIIMKLFIHWDEDIIDAIMVAMSWRTP